jgi:hypothetical protein
MFPVQAPEQMHPVRMVLNMGQLIKKQNNKTDIIY